MRDFDLEAAFDTADDYAPILQYCAYGTCVDNPDPDSGLPRYCTAHAKRKVSQ